MNLVVLKNGERLDLTSPEARAKFLAADKYYSSVDNDNEQIRSEIASGLAGKRMAVNLRKWLDTFDDAIFNPDRIGLRTYRNMLQTDETVSSSLNFMGMSAAGMFGEYVHPKPTIQKHVRKQLKALGKKIPQCIMDLCEAPAYGVSAIEVVHDIINGELIVKDLVPIDQLSMSIFVDLERNSKTYGQVTHIKQHYHQTEESVPIPIQKIMLYSYRPEKGNPWGSSRLRQAWKNWMIKDAMLKAWGLTLERFATPLIWGRCKSPDAKIPGTNITRADAMLDTLTNLQNTSAFVVGVDDEIGMQQTQRSLGPDFEGIQNHMNRMIYRALLTPALIWESTDVGSFALGKKHFKVFLMVMAEIVNEIIDLFLKAVVTPVVWHKFGPQDDYGTFKIRELQEEDAKILSDIFFAMTQTGYMSPRIRGDVNTVREKLSIPPQTDEEWQEMQKIQEEEQQAQMPQPSPNNPQGSGRKGDTGPIAQKPGSKTTPKRPTKKDGRPAAKGKQESFAPEFD